jgi:hypothetical protein
MMKCQLLSKVGISFLVKELLPGGVFGWCADHNLPDTIFDFLTFKNIKRQLPEMAGYFYSLLTVLAIFSK